MTATRAASAPPGTGERRRWLPFWLLQAVELVVAFVFVDLSVHVDHGDLLVAAAVVFALLAVTARGPLGLVRVCPPGLHLVLVIAACVLVALASVVPAFRPDIEGTIIAIFGCIGLVRLATLTRTEPAGTSRTRTAFTEGSTGAAASPPVIDASASVVHHRPDGPGARSDTGHETTVGRERAPGRPAATTAHHVGRLAATASEAARRTAGRNGPAARAYTKQSLRNAGRVMARWTSGAHDNHESSATHESADRESTSKSEES